MSGVESGREEALLPEMARLLDRVLERADDLLLRKAELAVLVRPALEVLAEGEAGDGHVVPVDELVLHQVRQDLCSCVRSFVIRYQMSVRMRMRMVMRVISRRESNAAS